nr:hypothetical protein [Tanacetum cinerariifolium]
MTITRINYESGNEKGRIELKGRFLIELRDNAFSGTNGEDPIKHIENFLEIVDLLNIPNRLISEYAKALEVDIRVSLGCSGNTTRIMRRTLMITLVFTLCEEQDFHLHCDTYVSLGCSGNTARIMRRTLMITLVFTLCEEQVIWNSVIMRLIDDLLALDSIMRFGFSDRRLERTATFLISTKSK